MTGPFDPRTAPVADAAAVSEKLARLIEQEVRGLERLAASLRSAPGLASDAELAALDRRTALLRSIGQRYERGQQIRRDIAVEELSRAIADAGRMPEHHGRMMDELRELLRRWPMLRRALGMLASTIDDGGARALWKHLTR